MLAGAFYYGRPPLRLALIMVANFLFSMAFKDSLLAVGVFDLTCAAFLIGTDKRANIVAGLFAMMIPVYIVMAAFHWQNLATYAIVDALAYLQFSVIGRLDGGISIMRGAIRRRFVRFGHPAQKGLHSRSRD